ncbi:MAG: hypothetical protein DMF66_13780 [Acidobacteria bacterium]|nr:MAG: hypothetical protein DMF66_13780 [Acidobacteriota bacterium]
MAFKEFFALGRVVARHLPLPTPDHAPVVLSPLVVHVELFRLALPDETPLDLLREGEAQERGE